MKPTNFRKPRTGDRKLNVQFRNGMERTYMAAQLIWADRGWDFDVIAAEYADKRKAT